MLLFDLESGWLRKVKTPTLPRTREEWGTHEAGKREPELQKMLLFDF